MCKALAKGAAAGCFLTKQALSSLWWEEDISCDRGAPILKFVHLLVGNETKKAASIHLSIALPGEENKNEWPKNNLMSIFLGFMVDATYKSNMHM